MTIQRPAHNNRHLTKTQFASTVGFGKMSIRLLSKLAVESKVLGDAQRRTGMYTLVHEDSSTASTTQFASTVGFGKKSRGFTLLELMVTFAIVLIISLVAYPVLLQYFVQSKIADVLQATTSVQSMVTNQIATIGSTTGSGVGLVTPTTINKYVATYSVSDDGIISITTTADAGAVSLTLTPGYDTTSEQVSWTCAVTNANMNSSVPNQCRI